METRDINYLRYQFIEKIFRKSFAEFQSFFEDIMVQVHATEFVKIRPYGNEGDGGNDGYIPSKGIYYQVYAPLKPDEKDSEAAKKLKANFDTLKQNWEKIATIKEFHFVFNDKYAGIAKLLPEALSELKQENQGIEFNIYTAIHLEKQFFELENKQISSLGFDIESTRAVKFVGDQLKSIENHLDQEEDCKYISKALECLQPMITELDNDDLLLSYKLIHARLEQKTENTLSALKEYEYITNIFPNNPDAYVYSAGIYLDQGNLIKHAELLDKATKLDPENWLLKFEYLRKNINNNNIIDYSENAEKALVYATAIKARFYNRFALSALKKHDFERAKQLIGKAIHYAPNRVSNYDLKLAILWEEISYKANNLDKSMQTSLVQQYQSELALVENKFLELNTSTPRIYMYLNMRKVAVYSFFIDYKQIEQYVSSALNYAYKCFFDNNIDVVLSNLLRVINLSGQELSNLTEYLEKAVVPISDSLANILLVHFNDAGTLLTQGQSFFNKINCNYVSNLINAMAAKDYVKICNVINKDLNISARLSYSSNTYVELKKHIIDTCNFDSNTKNILLSIYFHEQDNIQEIRKIIELIDVSKLDYFQSRKLFEISNKAGSDICSLKILEHLKKFEISPAILLEIDLTLFDIYIKLKDFKQVIIFGKNLLISYQNEDNALDPTDFEFILANILLAYMQRNEFSNALDTFTAFKDFDQSYRFKIFMAEIFIKNNMPEKALEFMVDGIILKHLKQSILPEEYASLYMLAVEITNLLNTTLTDLSNVEDNCFVKIKDNNTWFYIGNECCLDAKCINQNNPQYSKFFNQKVGGSLELNPYDVERSFTIEKIFERANYILWQIRHYFQNLSSNAQLDGVISISLPEKEGGGIDINNLQAFLKNYNTKIRENIEPYKNTTIPLAILAYLNGGLVKALEYIVSEDRVYIHCTSSSQDIINQKTIANKIINGEIFYIDATSAMILSESGLFPKISPFLSGLRVPQSVINFLHQRTAEFCKIANNTGRIGYKDGKILMVENNPVINNKFLSRYNEAIKKMEEHSDIEILDLSNKSTEFIEQDILDELCDACILAQKNNSIVLTEDHLYILANATFTKKNIPNYCSSIILIKTLYTQGRVTFEEYLDFFYYLSNYKFRFLEITADDMKKAVFGDGRIVIFTPNNLKKFNFKLTLSEEYGVPCNHAYTFIVAFLYKIICDLSIPEEIVKEIFLILIAEFPNKINQKGLGMLFLDNALNLLNTNFNFIVTNKKPYIKRINILKSHINNILD